MTNPARIDSYTAPPVETPIDAVVRPPGSKSATNRALILAALAKPGASRLHGALDADDTVVMRTALQQLGVMIDDVADPWLVLGTGGALQVPTTKIDVGASGTTARFITAIAPLVNGPVEIDGTSRMRERPISDLTDALVQLGAKVETTGGMPPVHVNGGSLTGGQVRIDGSRSSQFVSALLMLAPMLTESVSIEMVGRLVSTSYVATTIDLMRRFGAEVVRTDTGYLVAPTGYHKAHIEIEADASAAAYPLTAGAITGGSVRVEGIPSTSTQPDLRLLGAFERMGCIVFHDDSTVWLRGPERLTGVDIDMREAPDAAMALAVACLFADGPSRIRGLSTLRLKETDRLEALRTEILKTGANAVIENDELLIEPHELRPARFDTYDDHRMAMSFALVGLRVPNVEIADPGCVSKTWPGFFEMLDSIRG